MWVAGRLADAEKMAKQVVLRVAVAEMLAEALRKGDTCLVLLSVLLAAGKAEPSSGIPAETHPGRFPRNAGPAVPRGSLGLYACHPRLVNG